MVKEARAKLESVKKTGRVITAFNCTE